MTYFKQFNYVRMGGLEGFRNRVQSALICEGIKSKLSLLSQTYLNGANYNVFYSTYSAKLIAE